MNPEELKALKDKIVGVLAQVQVTSSRSYRSSLQENPMLVLIRDITLADDSEKINQALDKAKAQIPIKIWDEINKILSKKPERDEQSKKSYVFSGASKSPYRVRRMPRDYAQHSGATAPIMPAGFFGLPPKQKDDEPLAMIEEQDELITRSDSSQDLQEFSEMKKSISFQDLQVLSMEKSKSSHDLQELVIKKSGSSDSIQGLGDEAQGLGRKRSGSLCDLQAGSMSKSGSSGNIQGLGMRKSTSLRDLQASLMLKPEAPQDFQNSDMKRSEFSQDVPESFSGGDNLFADSQIKAPVIFGRKGLADELLASPSRRPYRPRQSSRADATKNYIPDSPQRRVNDREGRRRNVSRADATMDSIAAIQKKVRVEKNMQKFIESVIQNCPLNPNQQQALLTFRRVKIRINGQDFNYQKEKADKKSKKDIESDRKALEALLSEKGIPAPFNTHLSQYFSGEGYEVILGALKLSLLEQGVVFSGDNPVYDFLSSDVEKTQKKCVQIVVNRLLPGKEEKNKRLFFLDNEYAYDGEVNLFSSVSLKQEGDEVKLAQLEYNINGGEDIPVPEAREIVTKFFEQEVKFKSEWKGRMIRSPEEEKAYQDALKKAEEAERKSRKWYHFGKSG